MSHTPSTTSRPNPSQPANDAQAWNPNPPLDWMPSVLANPSDYTNTEILRRLLFAKERLRLNLAPLTDSTFRVYGELCEKLLQSSDDTSCPSWLLQSDDEGLRPSLRRMDQVLNSKTIFLWDRGESSLAVELRRLRALELVGNYGDYLPEAAGALRAYADGAEVLNPPGEPLSGKQRWTEIARRHKLDLGGDGDAQKAVQGPVINLCCDYGWDHRHMLWLIEQYASGEELIFNHCDAAIERLYFTEVAILIHRDLKELTKIIPLNLTNDIWKWQFVLETLKEWYFVVGPGKEDEPKTWIPNGPKALKAFRDDGDSDKRVKARGEQKEDMKAELAAREAAREMDRRPAARGFGRSESLYYGVAMELLKVSSSDEEYDIRSAHR